MKLRYLLALLLLLLPACTDSGAMPMTMLSGSVSSAVGDGWVGFGSESGADWSITIARQYWTPYDATNSGNVRYAHIWLVDGNASTVCLSLHSSDGTKLLSGSTVVSDDTEGWAVIDMGEAYEITATTQYLLAINRTGIDIVIGRTNLGPDVIYKDYDGYDCGQAIGEGTAPTGDSESTSYSITVVFDNTSDAAPSTP